MMPFAAATVDSEDGRILVVDDRDANVRLLTEILDRAGFRNVLGTTDPREVLPFCAAFRPDLLLLDLHMPHVDGYEIMEDIRRDLHDGEFFPILVVTADITPQTRRRALGSGATDFVSKPFDPVEVVLRIRNLLRLRYLHGEMRRRNETLEAEVRERTRELVAAQLEVVDRLTQAVEYRDDDTGQHTHRVGELSARIALELGLPEAEVELVRRAAPLHDVGKIAISDTILLKPGRLTPEEFEVMKTHTTIGGRILSGGRTDVLRMAEQIALCHHERWDGAGYPRGLRGEMIPLPARIVAVVDVYDALSHDRPYRPAWSMERVREEIRAQAGAQFEPRIAEVFLRLLELEG